MADYERRTKVGRVDLTAMLNEAIPERRVTPMPRQILVFWTPRLVFGEGIRVFKQLRRQQHGLQRAVVPIPNVDDPR